MHGYPLVKHNRIADRWPMRQYRSSMKWWTQRLIVSLAIALLFGGAATGALLSDPSSSSSNFRLDESEVGGAGDFDSSSGSFRLQPSTDDGGSTLGETATGNATSGNFQSDAGFNTTGQPALGLAVSAGFIDLGALSTSVSSTATASFSVRNYTSYGYVVQVVGSSPTNAGHPLTPLTTDTTSQVGQEQFGINLRANSTPNVGADPVPDTLLPAYSFGVAGDGITGVFGSTRPYTIPNKFRYASGETVASSPKSSGVTTFTLSFLANISSTTPGGKYTGNLDIVATGTY